MLLDNELEPVGRQVEACLNRVRFNVDQVWQDTGGYSVFEAYPAEFSTDDQFAPVLHVRVWGTDPRRFALVGYGADREKGRTPTVVYAEGSGSLQTFLNEHLRATSTQLRKLTVRMSPFRGRR